jgi:hypothetical protein
LRLGLVVHLGGDDHVVEKVGNCHPVRMAMQIYSALIARHLSPPSNPL